MSLFGIYFINDIIYLKIFEIVLFDLAEKRPGLYSFAAFLLPARGNGEPAEPVSRMFSVLLFNDSIMKNFKFLTLLTLASVYFCSSCTKVLSSEFNPESGEKYAVKVRVVTPSTKAIIADPSQDLNVHSLQVFAFLNGSLDVYGESQNDSLVLSCTQGKRKFYALINAPSLKTVETENELLATVSDLANSSLTSLEMVGNKETDISKESRTVKIEVSRLASRIVLNKITKDFASDALQKQPFTVKRIYLVNASGKATYGTSGTPVLWCNKEKFDEQLSSNYKKFMIDTVNTKIDATYDKTHTFYCYPNSTDTDVNGGNEFSPRFTRLVIEAEIGSQICYYPINLPDLRNNTSYNIANIRITKPGSTSPDEPVTEVNCEVTIVVNPWEDVIVSDGTTV